MLNNLPLIIEGCKNKQHSCQKLVYERFRAYALKVVFRYVHGYESAIDVVNDGFAKLFNSFERFHCSNEEDCENILLGWLKKIMINTAIDELRRNRFQPETGTIPDNIWNCSDDADNGIRYKELIKLIKELSPQLRAVFNLYVIDGYSHQEIAAQLGFSEGTSKSNLSRARQILQTKLTAIYRVETCSV